MNIIDRGRIRKQTGVEERAIEIFLTENYYHKSEIDRVERFNDELQIHVVRRERYTQLLATVKS